MDTRKKVLVVDDERSITQMMAMMLQTRGYDVEVAASGAEAIEKAALQPDVILLDLILPDFQGFEVCRRLREAEVTRRIPIIMISVKYLFEDKIEGLYLGADDYLTKPFDHEELFARMEAVMRRNVLFDESVHTKDAIIFELKEIIDNQQIIPFFQPIFFLNDFRIFGFETLSRPQAKNILRDPELLFKAALRFGFYCDLELMAWEKALSVAPLLGEGQKLFLNCNPYLVESPQFFNVKSLFEKKGMPPYNVVLEITERSVVSDFPSFFKRLKIYQDHGFGIAIDDVGRGYASLESIVEIKPSVVKIDNHLVRNLKGDSIKQSLVKFIVGFCRENKILSVAEGIENTEDLTILKKLGVDVGQGYLLSRPIENVDLKAIYKDLRSRLNISCPYPHLS